MNGFFVFRANGSGVFWSPFSRFPCYTVASAIGASKDLSFVSVMSSLTGLFFHMNYFANHILSLTG